MELDNRLPLEERVGLVAEAALADHQFVSWVDILIGLRWLHPNHVEQWRKGRIGRLEEMVQGSPKRIPIAFEKFRGWVEAKGLRAMEVAYTRPARGGVAELQFSIGGEPEIEKFYRTHYVSAEFPERQREQISARLERAQAPVVFQIVRESQCSECGAEIARGGLLMMDLKQPLCLPCAGLGDLEFLPAGDTALTRRSTKYSQRHAVVVRYSRSHGRYERQGIMVEPAALARAEQECLEDGDARERQRARGAERRSREDQDLMARMAAEIRELYPGCPPDEARAIAAHTAVRGSGRVGRSAAGRSLAEEALTIAVSAAIRHRHTNYDQLLASGVERPRARRKVSPAVDSILEAWRAGKPPRTEDTVCG